MLERSHTLEGLLHWVFLCAPDVDEPSRITCKQEWEWLKEVNDLNFVLMSSDGVIINYSFIVPDHDSIVATTSCNETKIVSIVS